jgi:hypothetical protein
LIGRDRERIREKDGEKKNEGDKLEVMMKEQ